MINYSFTLWILHSLLYVTTETNGTNKPLTNGTDNTGSPVSGFADGIDTSYEELNRNDSHDKTDDENVSEPVNKADHENTTKPVNNTDTVKFHVPRNAKNVSVARIKTSKSSKKTKDVWKNYDQVGAKNFIVVTVVVYSLVGTLSLLLMRMCRRAQRIHNETDRSDELVDQYLRASMDLKDQGYKERMLREKKKTCMTLTSIEEEQLKGEGQRARYHHVLSDVEADDVFLPEEYCSCLPSPTLTMPMVNDGLISEDTAGEVTQKS